jgi:homopolymeric O-antigen transport system permease protein
MNHLKSLRFFLQEIIGELIQYRHLLFEITSRDIHLRYKQTIMGFGWAVFMPLLNTAIFGVIFTRVAPLNVGMPYGLFAYTGLLAWQFTASSLRFAVISLTSNTTLVTKVYFPREIFPFSAIVVAAVDTMVATVVLVGLMIYYHRGLTLTILALPLVVVTQAVFTAGIALLVAMGNLFYRDIKYLFEIILSGWMFATSVVYPIHLIRGPLGTLLSLNPMTPIIDAYREILFFGRLPNLTAFAAAFAVSFLTLGVGWTLFHRAEFRFAENI